LPPPIGRLSKGHWFSPGALGALDAVPFLAPDALQLFLRCRFVTFGPPPECIEAALKSMTRDLEVVLPVW
jgi:hypothetical protein